MKNHKKLRNALATLLLALPLALQGAVGVKTAQAAETSTETATVTLHKYVFDKSLPSDKIDNSKSQDEINAWLTKNNAEALDGVEFTAYDVTSEYADAYKTATGNNNESPADAAKTASAAVAKKADVLQNPATVVGKQKTANGGLASFANLPLRDENGNYKAYLLLKQMLLQTLLKKQNCSFWQCRFTEQTERLFKSRSTSIQRTLSNPTRRL